VTQRNEGNVDRHEIDRARQIAELEMARVEVLDDDDAGIVAKRPVDLSVPDVESDDPRGAALQQDVGEAAVEAPISSASRPSTRNLERVQRVGELDAASAHVRMIGAIRTNRRRSESGCRFRVQLSVNADLPARISARARSRDGARPLSTTS
jgi:hypothetical protein